MSESAERIARCCCGDVQVVVNAEPHYVHGCHCNYCQRRTGSVWQVSCWFFDNELVSIAGDTSIYVGYGSASDGESESESRSVPIDYHFCKRCGSTVFWKFSFSSDATAGEKINITAVAVGCFTDKAFPEPISNHFVSYRPKWMESLSFKYNRERLPTPEQGMEEIS